MNEPENLCVKISGSEVILSIDPYGDLFTIL